MNEIVTPAIVEEISGSIATVRFNRPAQRNSLSSTTIDQIEQLLSQLIENDSVQAIIFTGSDDAFLSGADIRELATLDEISARAFSRKARHSCNGSPTQNK